MKKTKIITVISLLLLTIVLTSCNPSDPFEPFNQPGTKWISEDGSIFFYVQTDKRDITPNASILDKNGNIIELFSCASGGFTIEFYSPEGVTYDDELDCLKLHLAKRCEWWHLSQIEPNSFVAKVLETTFFEVGQKIKFHKVDE